MKFAHSLLITSAITFFVVAPVSSRDAERAVVERSLVPAIKLAGVPAHAETLAEEMKRLAVPGVAITVIDKGDIAWSGTYGVTTKGGEQITPSTRFQAGSISKSVAALAMLRLAAEGKVSLDRPVNDYLTSWKLPDGDKGKASEVTLRRLLSHTAGLSVSFFPGYAAGTPLPTPIDILDGKPPANTAPIRITSAPGSEWRYSGGGYFVAQQVAVDVTKEPFATWAKRSILDPANMTDSSFAPAPHGRYARGHRSADEPVPGGVYLYPESAAAGLWSTPTDLAHALLALADSIAGKPKALLPPSVAKVVLDPVVPGETVGFDTGGSGANQWIAKGGDTDGFASYMVLYPSRGQGVVVMTNSAAGATLARDLVRSVAQAYEWPDFGPRERRSVAFSPAQLTRLPGTYRYQGNHTFTVARDGDTLTIADPESPAERLYVDPSGKLFTLSQDLDYDFKADGSGEIRAGRRVIPFRKNGQGG
ncbi:serine hydrolase domain-containing protein [Luteibacter yeojuensis]|uniref:Beta-lactamase family protein n=1 Tax=Luteibacter yeojuensis TaxID=345309 RepID=A0A7X5QSE0_9GAMM|nr:serine hydrolase domain-containing protein [Luteibacter yeojuensis]NID14499.1 beta-lactamase family protein [Luteibacter yeojuensis]